MQLHSRIPSHAGPSPKEILDQTQRSQPGLVRELVEFCRHQRHRWIVPLVVVLTLVTGLVVMGISAISPHVYAMF